MLSSGEGMLTQVQPMKQKEGKRIITCAPNCLRVLKGRSLGLHFNPPLSQLRVSLPCPYKLVPHPSYLHLWSGGRSFLLCCLPQRGNALSSRFPRKLGCSTLVAVATETCSLLSWGCMGCSCMAPIVVSSAPFVGTLAG